MVASIRYGTAISGARSMDGRKFNVASSSMEMRHNLPRQWRSLVRNPEGFSQVFFVAVRNGGRALASFLKEAKSTCCWPSLKASAGFG